MIYYLAFGPLYRFPRRIQEEHIGYGYTLDIGEVCREAEIKKLCDSAQNKEICVEEAYNFSKCSEQVDLWLHGVNETCYEQINVLENCVDTQRNCITELNSFKRCEAKLERPQWLSDSYLKHLEEIQKPREKK